MELVMEELIVPFCNFVDSQNACFGYPAEVDAVHPGPGRGSQPHGDFHNHHGPPDTNLHNSLFTIRLIQLSISFNSLTCIPSYLKVRTVTAGFRIQEPELSFSFQLDLPVSNLISCTASRF